MFGNRIAGLATCRPAHHSRGEPRERQTADRPRRPLWPAPAVRPAAAHSEAGREEPRTGRFQVAHRHWRDPRAGSGGNVALPDSEYVMRDFPAREDSAVFLMRGEPRPRVGDGLVALTPAPLSLSRERLGERLHRGASMRGYATNSSMGNLQHPQGSPGSHRKPGGATTTRSAHMAAWGTDPRHRKRSLRQAGRPAPLRQPASLAEKPPMH